MKILGLVPPDPDPVELVIFDCDGVLVDSERISNKVLAEILGEHGISPSWEEAKAIFFSANPLAISGAM